MTAEHVYYLFAALLILVGLAGILLPALPGLPLVFAGMLLAAWAGDFQLIGGVTVAVLGILTLLSVINDLFSTAMGAQKVGASRKALAGSIIGTFAGFLFMPWGLLIGPFAGALVGELWHGRQLRQSIKVGLGTWLGLVLGTVIKLGLAFAMLGVFLFALFWN